MYVEYIFRPKHLKDKMVYSDIAREIVAKAMDGMPIDPAIFHRTPEGKSIQGFTYKEKGEAKKIGNQPPIVFDGGYGFIRIYGIGEKGVALLDSQVGLLLTGLNANCGNTLVERKQGKQNIEGPNPKAYSMRHLVLTKNPKKHASLQKLSREDALTVIAQTIREGMLSTARLLDETPGSFIESQILPDEAFWIQILEAEKYPIPIKKGIYAHGYKNVVFTMPFKATGVWQAGQLKSRGYGLIRMIDPNKMRGAA